MNSRNCLFILLGLGSTVLFSCKKNSTNPDGKGDTNTTKHQVTYTVSGTNFTLNFIDSNNVFESGVKSSGTWTYTFKQGSGANIGLTVNAAASTDVSSWAIEIDGDAKANAFSTGGAYFTVPY